MQEGTFYAFPWRRSSAPKTSWRRVRAIPGDGCCPVRARLLVKTSMLKHDSGRGIPSYGEQAR